MKREKKKIIDLFMQHILCIQKLIYKIDKWYTHNTMQYFIFMIIAGVIFAILVALEWELPAFIVSLIFLIGLFIDKNSGWCTSPIKFFLVACIMDFFIVLLMFLFLYEYVNLINIPDDVVINIILLLYLILWLYTSLIAKTDVAKLVNEVIAALTTTIFTIGTYFLSLNTSTNTENILLRNLYNEYPQLEKLLMECFGLLLPYIGITTLSMAAITIKSYWLKKHGDVSEIWDNKSSDINT